MKTRQSDRLVHASVHSHPEIDTGCSDKFFILGARNSFNDPERATQLLTQ